jgi:hypothetical protein
VKNRYIYLEISRAVWGLPQAGILAIKLLQKWLLPHRYYECNNTPGLWKHKTWPIMFTLVVDDFGVKKHGKRTCGPSHLVHQTEIQACQRLDGQPVLRDKIKVGLQCTNVRYLDAGIYSKCSAKIQTPHANQTLTLPLCGTTHTVWCQSTISPPRQHLVKVKSGQNKRNSTRLGSILYYARAIDITVLMALSSIAIEQSKGMTSTMMKAKQLLGYLATYPDATISFRASDMIINVHSDASYLSEADTRSCACSHFFMGWSPKDGDPIKLNGAFFTLCAILQFVVASVAEAELGALFLNCKEGMIFWLTLKELGPPQPKTLIHCNNATAVGIANNTVKWQQSRTRSVWCQVASWLRKSCWLPE